MMCFAAQLVRPGIHVGPAFPEDVDAILALLGQASGDCLPQDRDAIAERLGEFEVARSPSGRVVGCAAVRGGKDHGAELRCLTVDPEWRGTGTGRLLVERAVERARAADQDLFCVSRKPRFFQSLGFDLLPVDQVPQRPGAAPGRRALIHRQPAESAR